MDDLAHDIDALPDRLRDYVSAQQTAWQRVPSLALEADGRTGHSGHYQRAYRYGVWDLGPAAVDCETGDLVHPHSYSGAPVLSDVYEAAVLTTIDDIADVEDDGTRRVPDDQDLLAVVDDRYGRDGEEAYRDLVHAGQISHGIDWNVVMTPGERRPASDDALLDLVSDVDALDADPVVDRLETRAAQDHFASYDEAEKRAWRERTRRWTLVDTPYERLSLDEKLERWQDMVDERLG